MHIPFFGSKKRSIEKSKSDSIKSNDFGTGGIQISNVGKIYYSDFVNIYILPSQAYDMMEKIGAVFDAVDKIASRLSIIPMVIKDKDGETEKDHEILNLLNNPNSQTTKINFWKSLGISTSVCNEGYIIARGRIDRPPVSLEICEPPDVIEGLRSRFMNKPETYQTGEADNYRVYTLQLINGFWRYIDDREMNELIPIIGTTYRNSFRGRSRLCSMVQETIHLDKGNIHNSSLLKNGLNSSQIMSPMLENIDVTKGKELSDMLAKHHQGENNAGKPLIMPYPFKVIGTSGNNKDMDYMALIDLDETRIYRIFNIPLPLVKTQSMTMSNYETAIPYLYTDAVIPAYEFIAESLTVSLFPRYKDLIGKKLSYDRFGIPALETLFIDSMSKMIGKGATLNEIRSKGGYPAVEDGDTPLIDNNVQKYNEVQDENQNE